MPTLEAPLRNSSISILTDHLILTSAAFVNSGIVDAAGVTCVISAAPELPLVPLSENVTFHRVDILDCFDCNISKFFDDVSDLIEKVILLFTLLLTKSVTKLENIAQPRSCVAVPQF